MTCANLSPAWATTWPNKADQNDCTTGNKAKTLASRDDLTHYSSPLSITCHFVLARPARRNSSCPVVCGISGRSARVVRSLVRPDRVVCQRHVTVASIRQATCSRLAEDVVGADPTPYHVRLSLALLLAVLKGGPAIGSPGHLEDPGGALDRLHAQAAPDAAPAQVSYEGSHRRAVNAALRWCERIQVALKAIGRRPSGQPSALVERGQEGVVGVEDFEPASRDIGRGLSLARLPSGRPEPSLGGIDQGLLASAAR